MRTALAEVPKANGRRPVSDPDRCEFCRDLQKQILECECDPNRINGKDIVIEKGIPLPPARPPSLIALARKMEIGDSIFVPGRNGKDLTWLTQQLRKEGKRTTYRTVTGGVRIWRIPADKDEEKNGGG